jgi:SAM-dependent methyltransferase
LQAYVENDRYPLPCTADREGYYGEQHYDYWLSGLRDYLGVKMALARHGRALTQGTAVLDLGCASGRVLRHFLCQERALELWGADINHRHVDWMLRFLGPSLKVFQNSVLPSLPLEDNSMSLVCAFSVFTHIDAFELAWLAELRRVLKPKGIAYITVLSDHTWSILGPQHAVYNDLLRLSGSIAEPKITPELFRKPMPSARLVLQWPSPSSVYHCIVFHASDYIQGVWGRLFQVVEVLREASDYQDVVILEKT